MEPINLVYDICRDYIDDQETVDQALLDVVRGYLRARDLAKLSTCTVHFNWHKHTVDDWRCLRQIEAFFKKNALFVDREVCSSSAHLSFIVNEETCRETNLRIANFTQNRSSITCEMRSLIFAAQRYISNVLGDFQLFIQMLPNLVKVSPGATANASRRDSLPQLKMTLRPYANIGSHKYLKPLYRHFGFKRMRMKECSTNRVELVPKNWKTDRTIACEPEGSLALQLAFDTYAKRRLRRVGINLADQSANMMRAKHASVYDDYVTVDFSSASDTVAYEVVGLLFPLDWFIYLSDQRSPEYRGVFGTGRYHKFSSMGNGSTFCIETLIFAGACWAVGSRDFLVYGDDVIIEKEYYEAFAALTRFLGFTVNEEKTYLTGPFRESCGGDYFDGVNTTPVYIRNISKRKADLCHLVNTLHSIALPWGKLEARLLALRDKRKLPLVPFNESSMSGVWISPRYARKLGVLQTKRLFEKGPELDYYRAYVPKYRRRSFVDSRGYYLWFLYKNSQVLFGGPWEVAALKVSNLKTSSVPVFLHRYVRKWVSWHNIRPALALPDHFTWLENK